MNCVICGIEIIGISRKKYCGESCRKKGHRLRHNKGIEKHELMQCLNCGKTIIRSQNNQRYCSPKCAHKFYYDTHCATIIKRNTQNILAKMKLNPEFRKLQLELIRKSTNNRERKHKEKLFSLLGNKCEVCGIEEFDVLTVHHNDPENKPDRVSGHVKWKNLLLQYYEGIPLRLLCFNHHTLLHRGKLKGDIVQMLTTPQQKFNYKGKMLNEY